MFLEGVRGYEVRTQFVLIFVKNYEPKFTIEVNGYCKGKRFSLSVKRE